MQVVPAAPASKIISFAYDGSGLEFVALADNDVLGWSIDETDPSVAATPIVIGTLPPAPPDTGAVISPTWGHIEGDYLLVPDLIRGTLDELLTKLATNNGANRKIGCNFADSNLRSQWMRWAQYNPSMVQPGFTDAATTIRELDASRPERERKAREDQELRDRQRADNERAEIERRQRPEPFVSDQPIVDHQLHPDKPTTGPQPAVGSPPSPKPLGAPAAPVAPHTPPATPAHPGPDQPAPHTARAATPAPHDARTTPAPNSPGRSTPAPSDRK